MKKGLENLTVEDIAQMTPTELQNFQKLMKIYIRGAHYLIRMLKNNEK